jgi:DNA-binding NtrC family response regulator
MTQNDSHEPGGGTMTRTLTDTTETTPVAPEALTGFHGLVGRSAPMQALFERIRRVAAVDVSVLIVGETGTGKELVAQALHELSERRAGPFAVVTSAALTPDLVRHGLVVCGPSWAPRPTDPPADLLKELRRGTLLLDEVGDLALDVQAWVGQLATGLANRPAAAGVRLVVTTHRDLFSAVRAGRFRADLYYALRRAVLVVPPLRDRLDDLPLLVEHIRRMVNARHGMAIEGVTARALVSCPRGSRHNFSGVIINGAPGEAVGGLGPDEGFGLGVMGVNVGADRGLELGHAAMHTAPDLFGRQVGEPPLDPGSTTTRRWA